jgi:hypothetical protein
MSPTGGLMQIPNLDPDLEAKVPEGNIKFSHTFTQLDLWVPLLQIK